MQEAQVCQLMNCVELIDIQVMLKVLKQKLASLTDYTSNTKHLFLSFFENGSKSQVQFSLNDTLNSLNKYKKKTF